MSNGRFDCSYVSFSPSFSCMKPKERDLINRVQFMRDILLFFGVKFKITPYTKGAPTPKATDEEESEEDEEERNPTLQPVEGRAGTGEVLMSCIGVGYSNVNKSMA
jgi:RNA 3'-terminal phosphate cyclase-like protein